MNIIDAIQQGKTAAAIAMLEKRSERDRLSEPNQSNVVSVGAFFGDVGFVKAAIAAGVSASLVREDGYTALVLAAERGHANVIPILAAAGAPLEHELKNGNTALAQALVLAHFDDQKARSKRLAAAKALLDAGASPNVKNQWGSALLADAMSQGDRDAVQLLLRAGADITAKRANGETFVELAIRAGDPTTLIEVVERGVDPKPIVAWAKRYRHPDVLAALAARGIRVPPPTRGAPRFDALGHAEAVTVLEQRKVFRKLEQSWPKRIHGMALLHRGMLRLAKLRLDEGELAAGRGSPPIDQVLIVDGDLAIDGLLWNGEQDFGPYLIVLGDLVAKTIAVGGATIYVAGDMRAETFHGYYNHGGLSVAGDGRFGLFIADDYSATFGGKLAGRALMRTGSVKAKSRPAEADMRKVLAKPYWTLDDGEPTLNGHAIYGALTKGRSIRL